MFANVEDSLLGHHSFASHFPQRLAHVVSEYCDSSPWKLTFKGGGGTEKGLLPQQLDGETLALYNAADCRLTAKVWQRMQGDLCIEQNVYEHDKKLAAVCHEMIWSGIGIDHQRRAELSVLMRRRRAALKGRMRAILRNPYFDPGKLDSVRKALFKTLRGRYTALTPGGVPSTNNATLEALQGDDTRLARFARALLTWRLVGKVKSTYVDSIEVNPHTSRTHYNWKPFGTVSGRLSCRLQSCPRYVRPEKGGKPEDWARELYIPRRGNVFVYFDVSQAEMRLAAYLSADPVFMAACGSDVHSGNAKVVFPEIAAKGWLDGEAKKDESKGKPYRDIAKNLGFAIAYGAEAEKVFITLRSQGFEVSYQAVEMILARLRSAYRVYYRWVDDNLVRVRECGYMRTPILGRIRWLGWFPKPTDVSNYPVQSALADIMNARMIALHAEIVRGLPAEMVANIHDALILDVPEKSAETVKQFIVSQWAESVPLKGGPLTLPIDLKVGERWADLG